MRIPTSLQRLKGFRFPCEIIAYAVWAYHRFALSTVEVEDLLAEPGVIVSRGAVRLWGDRLVGILLIASGAIVLAGRRKRI